MNLMLVFIGMVVASVSWLVTDASRRLALRFGASDEPRGGRKIHAQATPLFGGVGIGIVLIGAIVFGATQGGLVGGGIHLTQLVGFCVAIALLVIGGALDDRFDLPPWVQIWFPIAAALIVIASGTTITRLTHPTGHGVWSLGVFSSFATLVWLLGVTYATKFMDGLDGLVAGETVIGAGLIVLLSLSAAYYQPAVAFLAMIVLAAYAGFLPVNLFPAKQFLGEAGSTLAGFALGFLAIVSGAKVATAFMAIGIPLVDLSLVILGRLVRRQSPFRGDQTHLHFKLLRLGLSQRQVVAIFWSLALIFGAAALEAQTQGKLFLVGTLIATTLFLSLLTGFVKPTTPIRRQGIILVLALVTGCVLLFISQSLRPSSPKLHPPVTQQIMVHGKSLELEVVSSPEDRAQGLSDRPMMAMNHGMLFVFEKPGLYAFWMPRMHFPLDIIWLNRGTIVDIVTLAPPRGTEPPVSHTPRAAADTVLELVAGSTQAYGLKVGDHLATLSFP